MFSLFSNNPPELHPIASLGLGKIPCCVSVNQVQSLLAIGLHDGSCLLIGRIRADLQSHGDSPVLSLCFHKQFLLVLTDRLTIWNLVTLDFTLYDHVNFYRRIANSSWIIISKDSLSLLNIESGQQRPASPQIESAANVFPNPNLPNVVLLYSNTVISLFDIEADNEISQHQLEQDISSVAWHPDGQVFAIFHADHFVVYSPQQKHLFSKSKLKSIYSHQLQVPFDNSLTHEWVRTKNGLSYLILCAFNGLDVFTFQDTKMISKTHVPTHNCKSFCAFQQNESHYIILAASGLVAFSISENITPCQLEGYLSRDFSDSHLTLIPSEINMDKVHSQAVRFKGGFLTVENPVAFKYHLVSLCRSEIRFYNFGYENPILITSIDIGDITQDSLVAIVFISSSYFLVRTTNDVILFLVDIDTDADQMLKNLDELSFLQPSQENYNEDPGFEPESKEIQIDSRYPELEHKTEAGPEVQTCSHAKPQNLVKISGYSVRLMYFEPNGDPEDYEIKTSRVTIGRSHENQIILKDLSVSKCHAVIFKEKDAYFIVDESTANGITINDKPIKSNMPTQLNDQDAILVGSVPFVFYILPIMDQSDSLEDQKTGQTIQLQKSYPPFISLFQFRHKNPLDVVLFSPVHQIKHELIVYNTITGTVCFSENLWEPVQCGTFVNLFHGTCSKPGLILGSKSGQILGVLLDFKESICVKFTLANEIVSVIEVHEQLRSANLSKTLTLLISTTSTLSIFRSNNFKNFELVSKKETGQETGQIIKLVKYNDIDDYVDDFEIFAITNTGYLLNVNVANLKISILWSHKLDFNLSRIRETVCIDSNIGYWNIDGVWKLVSPKNPSPHKNARIYDLYAQMQDEKSKPRQKELNIPRNHDTAEIVTALDERGEQLSQLQQNSEQLSNATSQFLQKIKDYNEREAQKKWWQL